MRFFTGTPLPYATHKNRWTGGYVPTSYCYYPPNIPGEFFEQAQLAPEPGHVFFWSYSEVFGGVRRARLGRCTFVAHPDEPCGRKNTILTARQSGVSGPKR